MSIVFIELFLLHQKLSSLVKHIQLQLQTKASFTLKPEPSHLYVVS